MFWGETVEAKKELYLECMFPLRLTKVTLGSVNDNERHFLKVTYSDLFTNEKKTSTICVLQKNKEENVTLDLTFDQGEPITFLSTCTVHLSGYYIPEDEEGDEDDEDSDEDGEGFTLPPGWDEEDDESFRIEGGEDDDDDDDEDDDDEDDDDEDDDEDGEPKIREVDSDDSEVMEFNEEASLPADILSQIAAKQKKIADASRKRKEPDSPQEAPQAKKQKTETPKKDQKQQQQQQQQQKQQTPGKNEPQQKAQTPAKKQEAPAAAAVATASTPGKKAETPAKKAETPGKKAETPKAAPTTPTAAAAASSSSSTTPGKKAETPKANKGQVRLPTGLIYEDVQLGTGPEAVPGKNVAVQYVGRLTSNNKVFDKSSGSPFTFRLGNGDVIKGWDQGVKGMKVGGKRKLIIPAELGYGKKGYPPTIPPNASLTFDVTLERIKS